MTEVQHEELANQTADIIREYWQAAYSRYNDVSLEFAVHNMLGSAGDYSDNICDYELHMRILFEELAKPEVSNILENHLGSRGYEETVNMFGRLLYFFRSLNEDYFRLQLDAYNIEHYYSQYSEEQLINEQIEFKAKLAG